MVVNVYSYIYVYHVCCRSNVATLHIQFSRLTREPTYLYKMVQLFCLQFSIKFRHFKTLVIVLLNAEVFMLQASHFLNNLSFLRIQNVTQEQQSTPHSSSHHVDIEVQAKIKNKQSAQKAPADARVRQLKDLLIRGKVYLSLTAVKSTPHMIRELRLRIKEAQRALGDASKDSDLPRK